MFFPAVVLANQPPLNRVKTRGKGKETFVYYSLQIAHHLSGSSKFCFYLTSSRPIPTVSSKHLPVPSINFLFRMNKKDWRSELIMSPKMTLQAHTYVSALRFGFSLPIWDRSR